MKFSISESSLVWRKCCRWLLALSWITGLFVGAFIAYLAGDPLFSLMRMALCRPVSIVSLLLTTCLPFLISAIAVYISKPDLLPLIALLKGVSFSMVSIAVFHAFGTAGWMMRSLVMFTDLAALPVLYVFWHRHISGEFPVSMRDFGYVLVLCAVCSLDVYWITPFLADFIEI